MKIEATELRANENSADFVAIVTRGANRRHWKIKKDDQMINPSGGEDVQVKLADRIRASIKSFQAMLRGIEPNDPLAKGQEDSVPQAQIQSVVFAKPAWSRDAAAQWCADHGFKNELIEHPTGFQAEQFPADDRQWEISIERSDTWPAGVMALKAIGLHFTPGNLTPELRPDPRRFDVGVPPAGGTQGTLGMPLPTQSPVPLGGDFEQYADKAARKAQSSKGFGDGPGVGFTSFDAALSDWQLMTGSAGGLMDICGLLPNVVLNVLNSGDSDKVASIQKAGDQFVTALVARIKAIPASALSAQVQMTDKAASTLRRIAAIKTEEARAAALTDVDAALKPHDVEGTEMTQLETKVDALTASIDSLPEKIAQALKAFPPPKKPKGRGTAGGAQTPGKGGAMGAKDDDPDAEDDPQETGAEGTDDGEGDEQPQGDPPPVEERLTALERGLAAFPQTIKTAITDALSSLNDRVTKAERRPSGRRGMGEVSKTATPEEMPRGGRTFESAFGPTFAAAANGRRRNNGVVETVD